MEKKPLTRKELREYLQISESTMAVWLRNGKIKPVLKINRTSYFDVDNLQQVKQ